MKMRPEHYKHMKAAMGATLDRIAASRNDDVATLLAGYRQSIIDEGKAHDVDKRVRWDICYGSGLSGWINDNLYGYMDDTHIDTALRRIMRELGAGGPAAAGKGDDMRSAARLAMTIVAEAGRRNASGRTRSFTPEQRSEVDAVLSKLVSQAVAGINAEAARIRGMDARPTQGWTDEQPDVHFPYVAQAMLEDLIHDLQELV